MSEPLPSPGDRPADTPAPFRWQAVFRRCRDPLFFLNRRRRLLFANEAWQELTGIPLAEARGLVCFRSRSPRPGSREAILSALHPPRDVFEGQTVSARRAVALAGAGLNYWDVTFVPFTDERGLLGVLGRIRALPAGTPNQPQPLPARLLSLRDRPGLWHQLDNFAGELPALRLVLDQVRLARQTAVPVLFRGEPGVGKRWLARTLHQLSTAPERVFAALDCRRLPAACLESVLFGDRGLVHGSAAGTIYLQEPQHLPRELQARLCEWLAQPSSADTAPPRLMAGCSADPAAEVRAGRLLEELSCALGVLVIALPPLRERLADFPTLAERLLKRAAGAAGPKRLAPEAWEVLRAWQWPGNWRELYTVLRGASLRARGDLIEVRDLPWYLRGGAAEPVRSVPLKPLLENVERRVIELALTLTRGNKTKAAAMLALLRPTLLARMEKFGLKDPRRRAEGPDAEESQEP